MKNSKSENSRNLRTWAFVSGGAALLAILTVVLCIMGGVFNFDKDGDGKGQPTQGTPTANQTDPPAATNAPEATPEATPEVREWNISAVAKGGGIISPAGASLVREGESLSFTMTPDEGYELAELKVDGKSVDPAWTYTFENVNDNHSIYAVFESAAPSPTPTEAPEPPVETPKYTAPPSPTPTLPSSSTDLRW